MQNKLLTVTVWGRRDQIEPMLDGVPAVISKIGTDSIDMDQPVVEIKFDPTKIGMEELFKKISRQYENDLGGIANGINRRMRI